MSDQDLPTGWSEADIRAVVEHFEGQTEDEQADEIEAAFEADNITLMAVPTDRVPEIQALLARGASS